MSRRFLPALLRPRQATRDLETKHYLGGRTLTAEQWLANASHSARRAWPVDRAVSEGFERGIWVYKAIDTIADHQAALDFRLRQGDEVIDDHPLVNLLNDGKANPLETGRTFRYRLSTQILLSPPGAFVEVTFSNAGTPVRLDLLPPGRTRPVPGLGGNLLSHFETITADGTRVYIDPERVRWFRKPHPTDPYRGMTPLEAAGLSVDLDFLARLYQVSFLRNDGRPGGIVAVEGRTNEADARLLESRFGRGPTEAGKVTVISGKLSYVDLASRPRDMAYGDMSAKAKEETLAAFGVGESVLGNSSGRTFDNAEQELFNFWTVTMPPHLRLIAAGFDDDSDDDVVGEFDTSNVEVLRRTAAARRAEAREELEKGAISLDEYRQIADYDPFDLPHTRALYVSQGRTPIPTREEDAVALGLAAPEPATDQPAEPGDIPPGDNADSGQDDTVQDFDLDDDATAEAFNLLQEHLSDGAAEAKMLPALGNPDQKPLIAAALGDIRDRVEADLGHVLDALTRRLIERTAARTSSPKTRKGTRHWQAEFDVDTRVGDALLEARRVAAVDQWKEHTRDVVTEALQQGARAAAAEIDTTSPDVADAGEEVITWLASATAAQAARLAGIVAANDAAGHSMDTIVAAVRAQLPSVQEWAASSAARAATAVVAAAQAEAARHVAGLGGRVSAIWHAGNDTPARPWHSFAADGQTRDLGDVFTINGAALRWPGDTRAPDDETQGCRCRLTWLISAA
ncbi:phage portal protein [Nonomuraea turkmeniaca]|uniref:phage portal protein n=1 Tax=Nonomuraea turkmeniaca TaxID=103838 RepID=UPI001477254D|nr:phage portal protein [Nonomuraea turkmeniaca]